MKLCFFLSFFATYVVLNLRLPNVVQINLKFCPLLSFIFHMYYCSYVPMSIYPHVLMSLSSSIPMPLSPYVPLSNCPYIPTPFSPYVRMPLCPYICFSSSLCFYVPMSLCPLSPYISMSLYS